MKPKSYYPWILILFLIVFTSCQKDDGRDLPIADTELILRSGQDKAVVPSTNPAVKVKFDQKPSKEEFKKKVEEVLDKAIEQAKKDKDVVLKVALESRKKNFSDNVDAIFELFCQFDGINLTFFYVHFWQNKLYVESINIQLFQKPPTDLVETHEDGHSLIADRFTSELSEKIASNAREMKKSGKEYWAFVQSELQRLDDCAQSCYDAIVGHDALEGEPAKQTEVANKVASAIVEAYCKDTAFDCTALCEKLIEECKEEEPEEPEEREELDGN